MNGFIDPYIDPETGILRNKINAKTSEELYGNESNIISAEELYLVNIPHTRDLAELQKIHKRLFGKVYDWAGQLRTVNIKKGSEEFFLDATYLENGAQYVFNELAKENYLKGLPREEFVKRLAYFYEQLNFIHPFREGNGRTQRIFWQRIAKDAGYKIRWYKVVGDELDNASLIGRTKHDLSPLEKMFDKIVVEI